MEDEINLLSKKHDSNITNFEISLHFDFISKINKQFIYTDTYI